MTLNRAATLFGLLSLVFVLHPRSSRAQAVPTAARTSQLSVFGGATGTYTGLLGGKNIGATAGIDYSWSSFRGFHPAIEARGSYPIYEGHVDSLKYLLGGLRVDHLYRNFRPYGDVLAGRGQIDYLSKNGFQAPPPLDYLSYISSTSTVLSVGGGVDLEVSEHFALKADYQYQFWSSPVTASGSQHPNVVTGGVVYHFGTTHPKHHYDKAGH
jgi:opacity protein-like surface antigen